MANNLKLEKELGEFKALIDEAYEEHFAKFVTAITNPPREAKLIKDLTMVRVLAVYIDQDHNLPLGLYEFDVTGSREQVARMIEAKHKDFIESYVYRKNHNQLFVVLKKNGMKDTEILDLLIPEASRDERDKYYNRFKAHWKRYKKRRKGTKS